MARRKIPDWIYMVAEGACAVEPRAHQVCVRCGARMIETLPASIAKWLRTTRAFGDAHAQCKAERAANG